MTLIPYDLRYTAPAPQLLRLARRHLFETCFQGYWYQADSARIGLYIERPISAELLGHEEEPVITALSVALVFPSRAPLNRVVGHISEVLRANSVQP